MKRGKMKKNTKQNNQIILLAHLNRCICPFIFCVLPMMSGKKYCLLIISVCFLLYGLYNLVGYKCRWKHIYCSCQYGNHEKMTPDNIRWNQIKKSVAYFIPILSLIITSAMLLFYFIG